MKPTPEIIQAAQGRLRAAYRTYLIAQLRWDAALSGLRDLVAHDICNAGRRHSASGRCAFDGFEIRDPVVDGELKSAQSHRYSLLQRVRSRPAIVLHPVGRDHGSGAVIAMSAMHKRHVIRIANQGENLSQLHHAGRKYTHTQIAQISYRDIVVRDPSGAGVPVLVTAVEWLAQVDIHVDAERLQFGPLCGRGLARAVEFAGDYFVEIYDHRIESPAKPVRSSGQMGYAVSDAAVMVECLNRPSELKMETNRLMRLEIA